MRRQDAKSAKKRNATAEKDEQRRDWMRKQKSFRRELVNKAG